MMIRYAQLDGDLVTALLDTPAQPRVVPEGRRFVPIQNRRVALLGTYDEATDTFTPPLPGVEVNPPPRGRP